MQQDLTNFYSNDCCIQLYKLVNLEKKIWEKGTHANTVEHDGILP